MSEEEDTHPVFPPEIEEIIFSFCAQEDIKAIRDLVFVAKRVYHWLIPQLYETALLHTYMIHYGRPRFTDEVMKKHGKHVRHTLFWDVHSFEDGLRNPVTCLSWCPNVKSVAFWTPFMSFNQDLVHRLRDLRITYLSFDINLFHVRFTRLSITNISFDSVTHLELTGLNANVPREKMREYFPSVTHILLQGYGNIPAQDMFDCWGEQLKVVVLHLNKRMVEVTESTLDSDFPDDPRFAVVAQPGEYPLHWIEMAEGRRGSIWRAAEAMIERRRREIASQ